MRWRRRGVSSFDTLRRRMLAETELALLIGMRFPHCAQRIPTIVVGRGVFHPDYARRFWSDTLGIEPEGEGGWDGFLTSFRRCWKR